VVEIPRIDWTKPTSSAQTLLCHHLYSHDGQEAIEGLGFLFVLDEPGPSWGAGGTGD